MAFVVLTKNTGADSGKSSSPEKKLGRLTKKTGADFPNFRPKMAFVILTKKLGPNPRIFVVTKKNCVVLRKKTGGLGGIQGPEAQFFLDSVL